MAQRPEDSGQDPASDHRSEASGGGGPYTGVDSKSRLNRTGLILGAILVIGVVVVLFAL